ncbi:MAG TPA: hypothetical protein VKO86_06115 [Gemmatimonadales bacterium]|nr:hypothetical protein [Gemmatimonadales bacterium]
MVKLEELERLVGERVTLRLSAMAPGSPAVTGRLAGVLRALDGAVVTIEPDGAAVPLTCHAHYIETVEPA